MKMIGVFKELEEGVKNLPSIFEYKNLIHPLYKKEVLAYLKHGVQVFVFMGCVTDPFKGTRDVIAHGPTLVTDGYWIWREDLGYFVEHYNIGLPEIFVEDVLFGQKTLPVDEVRQMGMEVFNIYNKILMGDLSLLVV